MWNDVFVYFWFCFLAMKWYRVASWEAISITIWNTCMTRSQKIINFLLGTTNNIFWLPKYEDFKIQCVILTQMRSACIGEKVNTWFHNHTNSAVSKTKILTFHSCLLCDFIMSSHCYTFVPWSTKVSQGRQITVVVVVVDIFHLCDADNHVCLNLFVK